MIKICKECGKEFEATDGRQKYCDRQHYRPCPVCGRDVPIMHLSNPTPKCSECAKHRVRHKKISVITETKSATEINDTNSESNFNYRASEYVTRKYVGRTTCGFISGHIYTVGLIKNDCTYIVHAIEDHTAKDEVNIGLRITNELSWEHFFVSGKTFNIFS